MANPPDYFRVGVKLRAILNGVELSVSSVDISYRVNEIPTANVQFAIGREVGGSLTGRVLDTLGVISEIEPFTPIRIEAQFTSARPAPTGKNKGFPTGSFVPVFIGFVSAPQTLKDRSGAATVGISCFGMPAALAGTTQYSAGSIITAAPANASHRVIVNLSGKAPAATLYEAVRLSCPTPSVDLWEFGILKIMELLLVQPSAWLPGANDNARAALDRINRGDALPVQKLSLASFNIQDSLNRVLAMQLCNGFWAVLRGNNETGDLWDVLSEFQQYFRFCFVPAIEEDSVAPITLNLNDNPWEVLDPNEYSVMAEGSTFDPKFYSYITEVGVYAKTFSSSPSQATAARSKIIGSSKLTEAPPTWPGRLYTLEAPLWLLPPGASAQRSLNPGGSIPDKGNPDDGAVPAQSQGTLESQYFNSGIGNAFAKSMLHDLLFAHRKLRISGRFRLDIAPGSTLQLNTIGERFVGKRDTLFGIVEGVNLRIGNGPSGGYAQTSFDLTNTRSRKEQDNLGIEEHPLFKESWTGGKLLSF